MTRRIVLPLLLVLLQSACAGKPSGEAGPQFRDRTVLTNEELNAVSYASAYEAVEALRSNWLRVRGVTSPDPNRTMAGVAVYLNNVRLGGIDALRGLSTREIVFIKHYEPAEAAARWGRDVASGVIYVSTQPSARADGVH